MAAIFNPLDLTGKTILVTGASSGIGRDTCVVLSQLGAKVVLTGRDRNRLEETLALMQQADHSISPHDVTNHSETSQWMSDIVSRTGPLFGLVHLAGISHTEAIRFLDMDKLEEVLDLNLKSAFSLVKAFRQKNIRSMPEARVVLTSSVSGIRGYPGMAAYAASKGGIIAITRPLALELAKENIRLNCVTPGFVHTEMTIEMQTLLPAKELEAAKQAYPLGLGTPRDISLPICFLLSPASAWMTGQSIVIDGGLTMK
ncbi:SDR family NAD(P)-dependent oxidoreductase [Prosthecobacter sp.]|uniref:SDR family NAD(P)-dependent oxidoreductase n=1 Tax=Prosthecobacter sp. TaxID=1965333 RepID=UPI0024894109|nr:SDR family NAD(P)-dependent oxidoreductase [Prosthecobacter sp.]MDI1310853.1 SDR family NAD(P)-dependent oxidoreductase [Prosthecobacter sp.]